jgi:hypothetical protein
MTRFLLDVATYQGALKPADVKRAEFDVVNLKVSHGLSRKSVHPDVAGWVDQARSLGLGFSTFHFFTADAVGADQAEYAFARIVELGLTYGTAHQLDVESNPAPTLANVRAYLDRMATLLGRPVALYTGDWWWANHANWNVADLTTYLWSAPNSGYLSGYPGDTSSAWRAGYGGWPNLSVMQYAVAPLSFPDGSRGTIDVSKSAIRDETVWRDLTIGRPGMSYAPDTLQAARKFYIATLKTAGYTIDPLSVGIIGDDSHANSGTSYHLGKDALKSSAYSIVESSRDRNGLTNAAMALDLGKFSITVKGKTHNLRTFSVWLVAQCKAETSDTLDIREVIYSADGETVKRWDRLGIRSTGDSSHTEHTHESWFRDSEKRDKTAHLRRYFTEIGVLDAPADTEEEAVTPADYAAIAKAVWDYKVDVDVTTEGSNLQPTGGVQRYTSFEHNKIISQVTAVQATTNAIATALSKVLTNVQADDADLATMLAAVAAGQKATIDGVLAGLAGPATSDEELATILTNLLGARAAAVGALLAGDA